MDIAQVYIRDVGQGNAFGACAGDVGKSQAIQSPFDGDFGDVSQDGGRRWLRYARIISSGKGVG